MAGMFDVEGKPDESRFDAKHGKIEEPFVSEGDDSIDLDVAAAVHARALADKASLDTWTAGAASMGGARRALEIARELDDPALLARAWTACGFTAGYTDNAELAQRLDVQRVGVLNEHRQRAVL